MTVTINGTTGITTPGVTNTGSETISGTLTTTGFNLPPFNPARNKKFRKRGKDGGGRKGDCGRETKGCAGAADRLRYRAIDSSRSDLRHQFANRLARWEDR